MFSIKKRSLSAGPFCREKAMFDNRISALKPEIYKFHASAVPASSYLDRLLGGDALAQRGPGRSVQRSCE
jgi:hypothetical protein